MPVDEERPRSLTKALPNPSEGRRGRVGGLSGSPHARANRFAGIDWGGGRRITACQPIVAITGRLCVHLQCGTVRLGLAGVIEFYDCHPHGLRVETRCYRSAWTRGRCWPDAVSLRSPRQTWHLHFSAATHGTVLALPAPDQHTRPSARSTCELSELTLGCCPSLRIPDFLQISRHS